MNTESDHRIVIAAIHSVLALNAEVGASNHSLEMLLQEASKDSGKGVFEKFCSELMAVIRHCFANFERVRPHLAKVRAHRDFHSSRLHAIPGIWRCVAAGLRMQEVEPLHLQAVSQQLFGKYMKGVLKKFDPVQPPICLHADEENAVRYASGYVAMKLLKKIEKMAGRRAREYRECLSHMANTGDDTSFYGYTLQWITSVNRGGLFVVNETSYHFFKSLEVKTQELLPQHLTGTASTSKDDLIKRIVDDDSVQSQWSGVAVDIREEEAANDLLQMVVDMWVTMRGFAATSVWMEEYKRAKNKTVQKAKSLRKQLQTSED